MEDSTRLGLGVARFAILGVTVLGTLAACAAVFSKAADVFKPIAALYQINPKGSGSGAGNAPAGGGTAASTLSPAGSGTSGGAGAAGGMTNSDGTPAVDPNALPQMLQQLSKNGNGDLKRSVAELQRALGQNGPRSPETIAAAETSSAELAELKNQLAQCREEIVALKAATQAKADAAIASPTEVLTTAQPVPVVEPDPMVEARRKEAEYAEAVEARREAEAAFDVLKANPKTTGEQVFSAAYALLEKRSTVTRLEMERARSHRMAVATVAD